MFAEYRSVELYIGTCRVVSVVGICEKEYSTRVWQLQPSLLHRSQIVDYIGTLYHCGIDSAEDVLQFYVELAIAYRQRRAMANVDTNRMICVLAFCLICITSCKRLQRAPQEYIGANRNARLTCYYANCEYLTLLSVRYY